MTNDNAPDVEALRQIYETDIAKPELCRGHEYNYLGCMGELLRALDAAHARIAELEGVTPPGDWHYCDGCDGWFETVTYLETHQQCDRCFDLANSRAEVEALRDERDRYKRSHDILADKLEQQRVFREEVEWRKREDAEEERKERER